MHRLYIMSTSAQCSGDFKLPVLTFHLSIPKNKKIKVIMNFYDLK